MIVDLIKRADGYRHFVIEHRGRHYGAIHNVVTGEWRVINSRSYELQAHTARWNRIVEACERHFAKIEFSGGEDAGTPGDHQSTETGHLETTAGHP